MSKYKKYTTGGGVNPFWILEQQKKNRTGSYSNSSSINVSININFGSDGLNGSVNFSKSKPDSNLEMAIKRTDEKDS